ncbi:MAG: family peptidase, partial [Flaviaesturariibacter sp.]|nr:family peptidase [Flaviaesturariibacter sp.]
MKKFLSLFLFCPLFLVAQKKPLDHSVYDGWQNIGERMISNDGKWVVYTVTPQEGDADLYIQAADGRSYKKSIARGYNALITEDSRFLVFKIKPTYKETRDARIKKKKPEDMPKDSIGIVELGKEDVIRVAKIKSYKTPQKGSGWVAYQKEKDPATVKPANQPTQRTVDSLRRTVDSLVMLVKELKNIKGGNRDESGLDADEDPATGGSAAEGSDLVLRNLVTGKEKVFRNVADYLFNALGQKLILRTTKAARDSNSKAAVILYDLAASKGDTILKGGNDFRNFAFTEDGSKAAFVAERDTNTKALQKFYGLYLYKAGDDSARLIIDKGTAGMELGNTISENANLSFSKSGKRLLFGTAPIQPAKDTTLIDIDLVKVDIWNYKDDYLQTQQLFQLNNELKRNYLAVYDFAQNNMVQIGSPAMQTVIPTMEGDGDVFIAVTDTGRRVESQWAGGTKKDVYAVNVATGTRTLVKKNHDGGIYPSATGKYILLYDNKAKNYFAWDAKGLKNITSGIAFPLYNEENDTPDDPNPYGLMGWHEGDSAVYVYDRYDAWKVDPTGMQAPKLVTSGRGTKDTYRYVRSNDEERFIKTGQEAVYRVQNQTHKGVYFTTGRLGTAGRAFAGKGLNYTFLAKSKGAPGYLYSYESFSQAPSLAVAIAEGNSAKTIELAKTNPQQNDYNWGTAELYKWTAFNGKPAEGILYKPEDFDPAKKYPMIIYFYEKLTDGLYNYNAPSPTPSRLNIPFFVSRGYLVFAPDIS